MSLSSLRASSRAVSRPTRPVLAGLAAATALVLTACGGGTAEGTGDSDGEGASGAVNVVETAFGPVQVPADADTVVALGWGDAETALELGIEPVGASDWLAFGGDGVGPWNEGAYTESPEIIDTLEPSYEQIAALEPDVILDVKSSGDQERYDRLSEIAPTVGVPEGGENYLVTNEQQVTMISQAFGLQEEGEALLDEVDAAFAAVREAHPEWEGLTATATARTSEGWGAYVEPGERVEFLKDLGFVPSPTIADMPVGDTGFSVDIAQENLDDLDADLIVAFPIYIETTAITDDPQWQQIPAVADGRSVVIDGDLQSAYSLGTVGAQLYAIEELTGLIEGALDS
ncbi:iron-siderophore ABC transporter substrate-binding protein [Brevibacterium litoralis]|uniref:iron-siderophore ABC transporter substrate-binding protein n=1 Tax=Brevibacterium litoralis TaxID=3138935 RepID=UPI0032EFB6BF